MVMLPPFAYELVARAIEDDIARCDVVLRDERITETEHTALVDALVAQQLHELAKAERQYARALAYQPRVRGTDDDD
jgi:hypothetical protein